MPSDEREQGAAPAGQGEPQGEFVDGEEQTPRGTDEEEVLLTALMQRRHYPAHICETCHQIDGRDAKRILLQFGRSQAARSAPSPAAPSTDRSLRKP